jgi:hypothetical protein
VKEVLAGIAVATLMLAALPWAMKITMFYFDYGSWVLGK